MNFNRTFAIFLRQYYLLKSGMTRIIPLFAWVGIDMILWGFMAKYLNSVGGHVGNFVPSLLGAVLFWDFMVRVMQGVTTAFFEDVWSRNFLNVFASPIRIGDYLGGLIAYSIASSIVGLLVMLLLAGGFFGLSFLTYGIYIAPFLLILLIFGTALGILAAAMVLRLGPASEWFVWPIPALLSPFAGVFYPISTLPFWMQGVSRLLPASYVFEGIRAIVAGESFNGSSLLTGLVLAAGYFVLSVWVFTRTYQFAVRTGLLARYSAESVS